MKNGIVLSLLTLLSLVPFAPMAAPAQEASGGARKVVTKVVPQYPSLARNLSIQGTVRAEVSVAANGKVKSVEVKGGHPLLCQAATDAIRQWKWESAPHDTDESVELIFKP